MQVVVLANNILKEELLAQGLKESVQVEWISEPARFIQYTDADAYIDLLFELSDERIDLLKKLPVKPVFINSINGTVKGLPENFVRFNGWPTFLQRSLLEAAAADPVKKQAETISEGFNKKIGWTQDIPGFISARVVSMIINEAYFTLNEQVSSKEETDTAMKLGTNYPYGPFEWAEKIGLKNILSLLKELARYQPRYHPSVLLETEANH